MALANLEVEQSRLMAELDAIGGDNEKWDAAREELVQEIIELRERIQEFKEKVNA